MHDVTAKVTLVQHTPEPAGVIAAAAKLCYASDTSGILQQEPGEAEQFVAMLKKLGHLSPIEHASFTFYVEGVSRAMTHQLVRHRLASYSQRSQRYVAHREFDYICPPELKGKTVPTEDGDVPAEEYFAETMEMIGRRYGNLVEALGNAGEKSNQDARYVLPNACETKIFITMNARELLHFFEERLCLRAQWEIRGVAEQMLKLARDVCPAVFDGAGPKCIREGKCPEGKKTCGKYPEVKARYG
ncbi:MAG: FAD-dependent thymidylate synthase [Phycisphaerae bacterium]